MISALFAVIWPPLGGIILKATLPLFKIMSCLAGFFSKPGLPVIRASNMMPLQLFIYYMSLFVILIMAHSSPGERMKAK